jgi:hypothetical protein
VCAGEPVSSDPIDEILKPSSLPNFEKADHTSKYSINKFGGSDFSAEFNLYGYDYASEKEHYKYRDGLMKDLWVTMYLDGNNSMLFHLTYIPNKPNPEFYYAEETEIRSKAYDTITDEDKKVIHYECDVNFPRCDTVKCHLKWNDIKIT